MLVVCVLVHLTARRKTQVRVVKHLTSLRTAQLRVAAHLTVPAVKLTEVKPDHATKAMPNTMAAITSDFLLQQQAVEHTSSAALHLAGDPCQSSAPAISAENEH
jgi:hypothetical protein